MPKKTFGFGAKPQVHKRVADTYKRDKIQNPAPGGRWPGIALFIGWLYNLDYVIRLKTDGLSAFLNTKLLIVQLLLLPDRENINPVRPMTTAIWRGRFIAYPN